MRRLAIALIALTSCAPEDSPPSQVLSSQSGAAPVVRAEGARRELSVREQMESLLARYIAAEKWEDHLPLVRDPDRAKPLMRDWYRGGLLPQKRYRADFEAASIPEKWTPHEFAYVPVFYPDAPPEMRQPGIFYFVRTPKGLRIDWEATASYNPMTLTIYQADRPREPLVFRVETKLSEGYYGAFREARDTHYPVLINDDGAYVRAYLPRSLPGAKELVRFIDRPTAIPVTLALAPVGPDGEFLEDDDAVSIVRVVSLSYIVWDDGLLSIDASDGPAAETDGPAAEVSKTDMSSWRLKVDGTDTVTGAGAGAPLATEEGHEIILDIGTAIKILSDAAPPDKRLSRILTINGQWIPTETEVDARPVTVEVTDGPHKGSTGRLERWRIWGLRNRAEDPDAPKQRD